MKSTSKNHLTNYVIPIHLDPQYRSCVFILELQMVSWQASAGKPPIALIGLHL